MPDFIERIPPWVWITIVAHVVVLGTVAYLILLERKVASWVQDRIGPNRVGFDFGILPIKFHFWGLGQPLADGLKFIFKEDYRPKGVDTILFTIAPAIMIIVVIVSIAVLPWGGVKQTTKQIVVGSWAAGEPQVAVDDASAWGTIRAKVPAGVTFTNFQQAVAKGVQKGDKVYDPEPGEESLVRNHLIAHVTYRYPFQIASLNIGVLFILAVLSLAVYGVVVGGWASNNKYSFLGGLRATANMISYEIPLGLAILSIVVMFGTLDLGEIVEKQAHYWGGFFPAWNVFCHPLAFFLFLVCIHAEANRAPFDIAEAEQELVGGYHTEYSSMRFALFFLAEYASMITTSAVCVALFFGGWHIPWLDQIWPGVFGGQPHPAVTTHLSVVLLRCLVFFAKTLAIIFVFMWTRWSLPRFRFDQIMMLAWRALIPISLAMLMVTAVIVYFFNRHRAPGDPVWVDGRMAVALLVSGAALTVLTMLASLVVPPAPATNRRVRVPNSRFNRTPLPGSGTTRAPMLNRAAAESVAVGPPEQAARVGS
jgi:NADH-quinone oxidoreductase subunit H